MVLSRHSRDLHRREALAMTGLAARTLALAELEDDQLGPAALLHDLTLDCSTCNLGGAELRRIAADHQHVVELHLIAGIAGEELHLNGVALRNSVLLSAGADDCVGHGSGRRNLVHASRSSKEPGLKIQAKTTERA